MKLLNSFTNHMSSFTLTQKKDKDVKNIRARKTATASGYAVSVNHRQPDREEFVSSPTDSRTIV